MDWNLITQNVALVGTGIAGAVCGWRFLVGRKGYVPVDDARYETLQETFNARIWMSAFVAVFIPLLQPTYAIQFSMPSGWAALVGGVLALAMLYIAPLNRFAWPQPRPTGTERSDYLALLSREVARARDDKRALCVLVPYLLATSVYIIVRHGDLERHDLFAYDISAMCAFLHVSSAVIAAVAWRALRTVQSELRGGLTDARVVQPISHPPTQPVETSGATIDEPAMPPFYIRLAKLAYEAVTGAAMGAVLWVGLLHLSSLPLTLRHVLPMLLGVTAIIIWRRVDTLWKPLLALGMCVAVGLVCFGIVLVDWLGVPELMGWALGGTVGTVLFGIVSSTDAHWRAWFSHERARWEFVTSLAACVVILAVGSAAVSLLPDTGYVVFSVVIALVALVAWLRVPERNMPYGAVLIVLFAFTFLTILTLSDVGQGAGYLTGFLLTVAYAKLGTLRDRFGPSTGGEVGSARQMMPVLRLPLNPFTNERRDLLTRFGPDECARRIEEATHAPLSGGRRLVNHTPEQAARLPSIEAYASSTKLSLARFRRYRTSIWTTATATLTPVPGGTRIRARAGMHSGFRVLYGVFALLVVPATIAFVIEAIRKPSMVGEMAPWLGGLAVFTGIAVIGVPRNFDAESRELLDFIEQTLDAQPFEEPRPGFQLSPQR